MKKFKFNLEAVLKHRKLIQEQKERELAQAKAALIKEQESLVALEREFSNNIDEFIRSLNSRLSVTEVILFNNYQTSLKSRIKAQAIKVSETERQCAHKRSQLERAMQDSEVIDSLKDKARDKFQAEASLLEQKMIDDLTTTAFARKQGR